MFDDSGISLSASDPNPTLDQLDDGGAHADFSSTIRSVGQWGSNIADIISGSAPTIPASAASPISRSCCGGCAGGGGCSKNGKLLLVGLAIAAIAGVLVYAN